GKDRCRRAAPTDAGAVGRGAGLAMGLGLMAWSWPAGAQDAPGDFFAQAPGLGLWLAALVAAAAVGMIAGMLIVHRRVLSERRLFAAGFDALPIARQIIAADGAVLLTNRACRQMFG